MTDKDNVKSANRERFILSGEQPGEVVQESKGKLPASPELISNQQSANCDPHDQAAMISVPQCPSEYDLVEKIGSGGMGTVFRARHKVLDKTVALKMLHKELVSDPVNLRRFQLEVQAAGSLTHANLAAVYDSGVTQDGSPFLVMDYFNGVGLDQILRKEGFLEYERFFNIFAQVCDALVHAHSKRIIHRDLKPSNIMIVLRDGGHEHVKLVDFGIARVLQQSMIDSRLTQTGEVIGSPTYMSPEQCFGANTDERSDIYSLGVVMYEALAGVPPFRGKNSIQIIVSHINEKPRLISKLRPDLRIPLKLEDLIMKALEKDPTKRFQSVKDLEGALRRAKDSKRSRLRSGYDSVLRQMRNAIERKFIRTIVVAMVVTGVLALVGLELLKQKGQNAPIPATKQSAYIPPVQVEEKSEDKTAFQLYLDKAQLAVVRHNPESAALNYQKAIDAARASKFSNEKVFELVSQAAIDMSRLREVSFDPSLPGRPHQIMFLAEPFFVQAIAMSSKVLPPSSYDFSNRKIQFSMDLAEIRYRREDYVGEEQLLRSIIASIFRYRRDPYFIGYNHLAIAYVRLADSLSNQHRYRDAAEALINAIKYNDNEQLDVNKIRWQLTKSYLKQNKPKLADQLWRRIVSDVYKNKDKSELADYMIGWEALLRSAGRHSEAASLKREIVKRRFSEVSDGTPEDERSIEENWMHHYQAYS